MTELFKPVPAVGLHRFRYRIGFSDTDAMGVVHHSNYVRILERARVDWMRTEGIMREHIPYGSKVLGVTKCSLEFKRPCRFDDEVDVVLEARVNGAVLWIRYAVWLDRLGQWITTGETEHAFLTAGELRPTRFPRDFVAKIDATALSEQWPPT